MSEFWQRLRILFHRERFDNDLQEEMQAHIEMQAEENQENGMPPEEARNAARRQFGNSTLLKETSRELWGWSLLEQIGQDIRYSARMLRKTSFLSIVGVVSLALGIGVNTGMWTVFNCAMLKPPPLYQEPDRLVTSWETPPQEPGDLRPVSAPVYAALDRRTDVFDGVGAAQILSGVSVRLERYPIAVRAKAITHNLLPILGVRPETGRNFRQDEANLGSEPVAVLSYRFRETQFDISDQVLGKSIIVNGVSHTVIGVMPKRFWFGDTDTDLWLPLSLDAVQADPHQRELLTVARLRPRVTLTQVRAQLPAVLSQVSEEYPTREDSWGLRSEGLVRARMLRVNIPAGVYLIAGMIWIGLLMACVNIASVIVGRSIDRGRETAIRAALGAGRIRLVRQFLMESMLLVTTGAVLAVPVAQATLQLLFASSLPDFPLYYDFQFDVRTVGFMVAVVLLTGIGSGLAPALAQSRTAPNTVLQHGGRSLTAQRQTLRRALVVSEVALTLTLTILAGAVWQGYQDILARSPGFETSGLLGVSLTLPEVKYQGRESEPKNHRVVSFLEKVASRLQTVPGIQSAAAIGAPPFWDGAVNIHSFQIPGEAGQDASAPFRAACNPVTAGYFLTLGVPLARGRPISALDDERTPLVVWINQTMAHRYWPGKDPIGSPIQLDDETESTRLIAGIVSDTRNRTIMAEPGPALYIPYSQYPSSWLKTLLRPTIMVRSAATLEQIAPEVRNVIAGVDPDQAASSIAPVESHINGAAREMLLGVLLPSPAIGLGLLLSALGVYGVLAHALSRRIHEIGIRMALGARRENVLRLLVAYGFRLTIPGVLIGVVMGWAAVHWYAGPLDSTGVEVYLVAAVLLSLVGALASYIPARSAARIDPMEALRYE